jgi:hypothetical protein
MSEALDREVLETVGRLLEAPSPHSGLLMQRLWSERETLIRWLVEIRDWDAGHSEALSVERVLELVDKALQAVGE